MQGFDPATYFGGIRIDDLDYFDKDSRLSEMFKNAHLLESKQTSEHQSTEIDSAKIEEYTRLL